MANKSDWVIENYNASPVEPENKGQGESDWVVEGNANPPAEQILPTTKDEGVGESILKWPFRATTDLAQAGWRGLQTLPEYYHKAGPEVRGLYGTAKEHPGHLFGQGVAGLGELGRGLFNLPHNLINYLSTRLNLFPQDINKKIQMGQMPESVISSFFSPPQYPGEAMVRGIVRNAPIISGVSSLVKPFIFTKGKKYFKNALLNSHDELENKASDAFKDVSHEVNLRGINNIPIDKNSIENLKEYFPRTRQANELLEKGSKGDYNALRQIQADLYHSGKKSLGSELEAERMRGAEMFERREDINDLISHHLLVTGNPDLYEQLMRARHDYRTLQNIFYNPHMNNSIVNMVNKDIRKIPKNLISILGEESKPMKALLDFHPGLESKLSKYNLKRNALKTIKKYGTIPVLGAGGYLGMERYRNSSDENQY